MSDIYSIRKKNLHRLVIDNDGQNNLARRLGLTKGAYISQLLAIPPIRTLSEKTARKWERQLGLPHLWMDQDHTGNGAASVEINHSLQSIVDRARVYAQAQIDFASEERVLWAQILRILNTPPLPAEAQS